MSRLHVLVNRPRRTLAALATVLVAAGVTAASGASFTATSANPGNVFAAGTLTMDNSKAGNAILSVSGMRPGDPASLGTVDVQNTGSLSGKFTIVHTAPADSNSSYPMSGKLGVVVSDCGTFSGSSAPSCTSATPLYAGTLAAMPSSIDLGTFNAGVKHRYQVSVQFDSTADNHYQGGTSSTDISFNAV